MDGRLRVPEAGEELRRPHREAPTPAQLRLEALDGNDQDVVILREAQAAMLSRLADQQAGQHQAIDRMADARAALQPEPFRDLAIGRREALLRDPVPDEVE